MIVFACPGCGSKLSVKDELAGKRGSCPHCKKPLTVPVSAPPAAVKRKTDIPQPAAVQTSPGPAGINPVARPAPNPAEAATAGAPEGTSAPQVAPPKLDFLAPPKKPDEIGRLGQYRILKVLGEGGMGMVLQAEDPLLKRSVALKVMRPEIAANEAQRKRFLREAQATAALEHDHVIPIFQVGVAEGRVPFIAMPLLKGETLGVRLKRQGKLPIADALRIGREIALGLSAAHQRGLIHRDIKPANVWLETRGEPGASAASATGVRVKILDFGLARLSQEDVQLTKSGAILGTPAYMAPEQAQSKGVDFRCDLFSLGAVLYELLTGERPFKGVDMYSTIVALISETPRTPRELDAAVPRPLSELVMQLLAKEPKQRPPSAKAVADALAALEDDKTQVLQTQEAARVVARGVGSGLLRLLRGLFGFFLCLLRIPGRAGLILKGLLLLGLLVPVVYLLLPLGSDSVMPTPPTQPQQTPELAQEITNSIGMKLKLIPAGKFMMGSLPTEPDRREDEGPRHEVEITTPFYLGIHEVTQKQYATVTADYPSQFRPEGNEWWQLPVERVTYDEAVAFCLKLSERPEEKKAGRRYRLPTEAEWEYACRAGADTPCFFDPQPATLFAWINANSQQRTHPVGQLKPNAWGLYDMNGNVWEWCSDYYGPYPPLPIIGGEGRVRGEPTKDPQGPKTGDGRVLRGGSWNAVVGDWRAAFRYHRDPGNRNPQVGFRVVAVVGARTP